MYKCMSVCIKQISGTIYGKRENVISATAYKHCSITQVRHSGKTLAVLWQVKAMLLLLFSAAQECIRAAQRQGLEGLTKDTTARLSARRKLWPRSSADLRISRSTDAVKIGVFRKGGSRCIILSQGIVGMSENRSKPKGIP